MKDRTNKLKLKNFQNIASIVGKTPENISKHKSSIINISSSLDLPPPEDLPPNCPSDQELFGEKGCLILGQLEGRLREFVDAGLLLSHKCKNLLKLLEEKLSNLGLEKVKKLEDGGQSSAMFIQRVYFSAEVIADIPKPFPIINKKLKMNKKMNQKLAFSDIIFCFNQLRDYVVKTDHNYEFKLRGIHCTLLTLSYKKLITSVMDVSDIQNELISPLQRLTKLDLFAKEAISSFMTLRDATQIREADKNSINETIGLLKELEVRGKVIGTAVDAMLAAIEVLNVYNPKSSIFTDHSVLLLDFIQEFVSDLVPILMQTPMQDLNEFKNQIEHKINTEFTAPLHTRFIYFSDYLFFDLKNILNVVKKNSYYPKVIDKLLNDLAVIHENHTLGENQKFHNMKQTIIETHAKFKNTLSKSIFYREDCLENELLIFSKDMNRYLPPPCWKSENRVSNIPK